MLEHVDTGERQIEAYRGVAPDSILDDLIARARGLRGARVLHVNATPYGGGVSELLRSVVPLLNDLGLIADWKIISGDDRFFAVTKAMHNALQGAARGLGGEEQALYQTTAKHNARLLEEEYDFVFVHDPQPAAIVAPNAEVWAFLLPYLTPYDAAVFTMAEFVPPDFPVARVEIVPPAIDPLSPKNLPLDESVARQVLGWIGIRPTRALLTQVSRFDPWKDPLGVIAAYRLVREEMPNVQLALVGSMATDDPEGWEVYRQILEASRADPFIHVFTNLTGVGNIEVNAFQRLSHVTIQKSLREGFGLVVSEALWKGTPVVAGRAGGIPLQMADDVGGLLVEGVEDCAAAILALLRDRERAAELGRRGRERVREHFLLPRLLLNELTLMEGLAAAPPLADRTGWERRSDPVCGMAIGKSPPALAAAFDNLVYVFCSEGCRARFLEEPERYVSRGRERARRLEGECGEH